MLLPWKRLRRGIGCMAFENVRRVLRAASPLSSFKLLAVRSTFSRPQTRGIAFALLRLFLRDGAYSFRYRCYERRYSVFLRRSDLESDSYTALELGIEDTYALERDFQPDTVVDGGGNIGLFTLRAAAAYPGAKKLIVCEPLPRNVAQIQRHLDLNGIQAEVMPCCLGGTHRTMSFYCRDSLASSFDGSAPYTSVMEIPVITLTDILGSAVGSRILIKLDIEGMEVETLASFVPGEQRAVYIVGELHHTAMNIPTLKHLFHEHRWAFESFHPHQDAAGFRACSPAAIPLLEWARSMAGGESCR